MIDWISVDERLPDNTEPCLVYGTIGFDIAIWRQEWNAWAGSKAVSLWFLEDAIISHWAPINKPSDCDIEDWVITD